MSIYNFVLDRHLILFRPSDNRLFLLNPTAGWIWQATAAGMNASEIAGLLAEQYSVPVEEIEQDVTATLEQWHSKELEPAVQNTQAEAFSPPPPDAVLHSLPADRQPAFQQNFSYGQNSFSLTVYPPELRSSFAPLLNNLAPLTSQADIHINVLKDKDEYIITKGQLELERTLNENIAVGRVLQAMVEYGYPDTAWMAYIHASAGDLAGHGVIFPAIGGSGKSTLMAALSCSGWTYWGDDTVPLNLDGNAGAMHLNQCIKSGSWEVLKKYYPDMDQLPEYNRYNKRVRYLPVTTDQKDYSSTFAVHKLVFPSYSADCRQSLEPITAVQALQFLIDAQTWISPDPVHAETMINWISTIPAFTLRYHDLDWAAAKLETLIQNEQNS